MKHKDPAPSVDNLKQEIAQLVEERDRLQQEVEFYRNGLRLMSKAEWKSRLLFNEAVNALRVVTFRPESSQRRSWIVWFR